MDKIKNNIILASASPRRQELLKLIFEEFSVIPSSVEEKVPENITTDEIPEYLARLKAEDISDNYPESLVIGADTAVIIGESVLGKPKDFDDAYEMLSLLSGKEHKVITGVAFFKGGFSHSFSVETKVEFYPLGKAEIIDYINSKDCLDKAGGYGIQSKGGLFVKGIKGDYFNVVGLPIAELNREIKEFLKRQA